MSGLQNRVQLITYPDSIGKGLKDLRWALDTHFAGLFGGVHILPFYPSSADRGFAPLTHLEVDPQFGTWEDIRVIAASYDLLVDLVVNHMSNESTYFRDVLAHGSSSQWNDLFIDVDELLKRYGESSDDALAGVYRPRPGLPIKEFELKDGTTKRFWCTFTHSQMDLDLSKEKARDLMKSFIVNLAQNGAKCIRLDAVGYAMKKPHTNCFLLPETYDLIRWLKETVGPYDTEMLVEVHHEYHLQLELAKKEYINWVYDFALPFLTLHALHSGTSDNLKNWIRIRPANQLTTLDTHDGIGVVDVDGLMTEKEVRETMASIHAHGGQDAMRASGHGADNVDVYQVNCTYYSALGENDDAYITARAIQFFIPGIPQVYYVGLLAGTNDIALLNRTNNGRDINRHYYSLDEVQSEMGRDVVQRLFKLIRFRNTHPAFNGTFTMEESSEQELKLHWQLNDTYCRATIHLEQHIVSVEYTDPTTHQIITEVF